MIAVPARWRTITRMACLAILAAVGLVIFWKVWLEDRVVPKRWGVVEPGRIFRSGQISAALIRPMLQQHHIQVVVQLTGDDPADADQAAEHAAIHDLGIELHRCPLHGDGTGDVAQYVAALRAIVKARESNRPVLVHCHAGSQRTGGVVAAYRLLIERKPVADVLAELEDFGWRPGRDAILREYLERHLPEIAQELQTNGTTAASSGREFRLR